MPGGDDGDLGENLIGDLFRIFGDWKSAEAIPSGTLATKLREIEEAPWSDMAGGKGLTPHRLARMLIPFGVQPRQGRTSQGAKIRGYWLSDLAPVFERYLGQLGQCGNDAVSRCPTPELEAGTELGPPKSLPQNGCPTCPTEDAGGPDASQ
jgi:hypothetical protein